MKKIIANLRWTSLLNGIIFCSVVCRTFLFFFFFFFFRRLWFLRWMQMNCFISSLSLLCSTGTLQQKIWWLCKFLLLPWGRWWWCIFPVVTGRLILSPGGSLLGLIVFLTLCQRLFFPTAGAGLSGPSSSSGFWELPVLLALGCISTYTCF